MQRPIVEACEQDYFGLRFMGSGAALALALSRTPVMPAR